MAKAIKLYHSFIPPAKAGGNLKLGQINAEIANCLKVGSIVLIINNPMHGVVDAMHGINNPKFGIWNPILGVV